MRPRRAVATLIAALALVPAQARAGGGSRNVLVVANEASEESLEIANHYQRARAIPAVNVCRITTTTALSTDKATYQNEIESPIEACIAASPYRNRIDYIVLTRGLPIRAAFPGGDVSLAALLQAMDTTLRGKDQEYAGPTFGFQNYPNPYRNRDIAFTHAQRFGVHNLRLATMLSGYWPSDGTALVDRALLSDDNPPTAIPGAIFFLEDASGAADVRNGDFPAAVANLQAQGFTALHVQGSDPEVQGQVVAAHVSGGVYSAITRADIDSSSYPPGAIVCALESFGLTPSNFTPGLADQVPVTWWVAAGVTGAHGTVSEPYNVAFPDGFLLEPWVAGYNLAETFYQGIPYLYWMNLVLGDPLTQPYAIRPSVNVLRPAPGASVSGTVTLEATASTARAGGIAVFELWVDDQLVRSGGGASVSVNWNSTTVADGWHRLEAVAFDATRFAGQRSAGIDFRVDNGGRVADIVDPPAGSAVAGTFPVTIEAPGASEVRLLAGTLDLGLVTGSSPFVIDVDANRLGRGLNALIAEATVGAARVRSARHDLRVVKAPRIAAFGPPISGPQSGGTRVPVEGYNLEPDVAIWFGSRKAGLDWQDANHLVAIAPTGAAGTVDVRFDNPAGQSLSLSGAYSYDVSTCPATDPVQPLELAKTLDGRLDARFAATSDPCWSSYRVFAAVDPPAVPAFPADYLDVTASDEDGDAGGDASFLWTAPAASRIWIRVAAAGTDGSLGP